MAKTDTIEITVDGEKYTVGPREFKSGRVGYGVYGKQAINGAVHQLSLNIVKVMKAS